MIVHIVPVDVNGESTNLKINNSETKKKYKLGQIFEFYEKNDRYICIVVQNTKYEFLPYPKLLKMLIKMCLQFFCTKNDYIILHMTNEYSYLTNQVELSYIIKIYNDLLNGELIKKYHISIV